MLARSLKGCRFLWPSDVAHRKLSFADRFRGLSSIHLFGDISKDLYRFIGKVWSGQTRNTAKQRDIAGSPAGAEPSRPVEVTASFTLIPVKCERKIAGTCKQPCLHNRIFNPTVNIHSRYLYTTARHS